MKKWLLMLIALALILCAVRAIADDPGQHKKTKFYHKTHVVEEELECVDCHEMAGQSTAGSDNLFPVRSVCMDCHDEEPDKLEVLASLTAITSYSEKFSHERHQAAGYSCESCHSAVNAGLASERYVIPDMMECMTCHENKAIVNNCQSCHRPEENLLPVSHRLSNFDHNHGDLARNGVRMVGNMECATCHKQQFCQDCHENDNIDRRAHALNFEVTHALVAQAKQQECATCHTERQFCIDCHSAANVLPRSHKVGWTNRFPGDGGRHRIEALNDLDACLACHEQNAEVSCAGCHGS